MMYQIPDAPWIRETELRGTDYIAEWWQMSEEEDEDDDISD